MSDDSRNESYRDAFASVAEIAGDGAECPSADLLWRSGHAELEPRRNEAVILHVGECTVCAAAWRLSHELARSGAPARVIALRPRRRWRFVGVYAAAAGVVLAFIGVGIYRMAHRPEAPGTWRNQETEIVTSLIEDGELLPRDDFRLQWAGGPEGTTYDVVVSREDLRTLARGRQLDETSFVVPVEALRDLPPGAPIFWRVTARLPDGRTVASESFMVRLE